MAEASQVHVVLQEIPLLVRLQGRQLKTATRWKRCWRFRIVCLCLQHISGLVHASVQTLEFHSESSLKDHHQLINDHLEAVPGKAKALYHLVSRDAHPEVFTRLQNDMVMVSLSKPEHKASIIDVVAQNNWHLMDALVQKWWRRELFIPPQRPFRHLNCYWARPFLRKHRLKAKGLL